MTETYRLGVLNGDGIGPEIVQATAPVVEAAIVRHGAAVQWAPLPMGWEAIRETGEAMPSGTVAALRGCHGWILGPHDSVSYPPALQERRNPSGELRHLFDLYANIRPCRSYPGVQALAPGADLVIVRENTEGFYPDRNMFTGSGEWMPTPDVAISVGVFTRRAAERVARTAFRLAMERDRHVTVVHKANVIRLGTGLFLDTCRTVAKEYPEVRVDDEHVDAMAAHLVRRTRDFDVIVTTNMFGDILSDLAAELTGSLGLAPSINAGDDRAMAQAAHGSAPDIAGKGIANPTGILLSSAMLLHWLGGRHNDPRLVRAAGDIERAVEAVYGEGACTPDLGGTLSTTEFARAVERKLAVV